MRFTAILFAVFLVKCACQPTSYNAASYDFPTNGDVAYRTPASQAQSNQDYQALGQSIIGI